MKRSITFACTAALALALGGCGAGSDETAADAAPTASAPNPWSKDVPGQPTEAADDKKKPKKKKQEEHVNHWAKDPPPGSEATVDAAKE